MTLTVINTFYQVDVVHGMFISDTPAFAKPTARNLQVEKPTCDLPAYCTLSWPASRRLGGEGGIDSLRSGLRPKACGFAPIPPILPLRVNLTPPRVSRPAAIPA